MAKSWQTPLVENNAGTSIKWLAGFFEGEGSISASIRPDDRLSCDLPKTRIKVQVATTNKDEPKRFKGYFGVGNLRSKEYSKETYNTQWSWYANGKDCRYVLEQLEPHLFGPKKKQAQLALEYFRLGGYEYSTVPRSVATNRLEIAKQMRSLTQGPTK